MKQIYFFIGFTLMLVPAFAQKQSQVNTRPVITYHSIPKEGTVLHTGPTNGLELRTGWLYRRGDNPAWAKPDWDDHTWTPVDPWQPSSKLLQIPSQGIGWLRLHFRLADQLRHQPLFLRLEQYGAAEIYLNGRLIQRFGQVSTQPDQLKTYNPINTPVSILVDDQSDQVLAIRFAPWPPIRFFNEQAIHPVFLATRLITQAQADAVTTYLLGQSLTAAFLMGIFLLLVLFHTAFFLYNPAQRANLYFTFYACTLAASSASIFGILRPEVEVSIFYNSTTVVLNQLSFLWLLRAMYALVDRRPTALYYGLWVIALIGAPITLSNYFSHFFMAGLFVWIPVLLAFVEQLRLTFQAFRRKQRGVAMIIVGFAISAVTMTALMLVHLLELPLSDVRGILFALGIVLSPPLSISLYLAREFALDSQLLQVKLVEVQTLSAQTIAQEQEKQHLLATQNERLEQQVTTRTAELSQSLIELKATQDQLIQKEKLASLGELTAGIAHEIQNPLNFVNNFSEVSAELIEEQKEALVNGDVEEAGLIANDLSSNLRKIHHHGGRAAAIVRGMLEHSRTDTGERRPTDLNALAGEYLNIAYHGLRAKDKNFNSEMVTDFSPDLGRVTIAPQEIGRVLLNLYNNAFYAVSERAKTQSEGYRPTVSVSAKRLTGAVEIRVWDNGTGIPDAVKAKIFQPFFTTKPTGEGTGLGLSLSYDIITKGHEGSLTVESKEGEGTEFVIELPV